MLLHEGTGLLDKAINNLPFELHIPTYKFCGPGTRLEERLRRGDRPKNKLDALCRSHDIAYAHHKELADRHLADKVLEDGAWERVKARDAGFGEKAAALLVTGIMKAKRKIGAGCSRRRRQRGCPSKKGAKRKMGAGRIGRRRSKANASRHLRARTTIMPFSSLVRQIRQNLHPSSVGMGGKAAAASALKVARNFIRKKKVRVPRIIPIPKTTRIGGVLPLIPLFAGLSALGALAGGAAGIAKTVTEARNKAQQLDEMKRHNSHMESIALGKKGSGLYLRRRNTGGYGLYLSSSASSSSSKTSMTKKRRHSKN